MLPEAEIVIPDAELTAQARAEQQAGSCPDPEVDDEAKAKLALSAFVARIRLVTINRKAWHRVRVGPYATARELDDARRTLTANGIDAIALREKQ